MGVAMATVGFSDTVLKEVNALFGRYPKKVHALLPLLHIAQRENGGWLPPGWDRYIADLCDTTLNHVRGVVTFYNMFRTTPPGKFHIMVCTCVPCGLCGGGKLLEHLEERLDIHAGQTTPDGVFSLEEAQCLAACDRAPLMMVNEDLVERVTLDQVDRWIEEKRKQRA
jgi:NADH-quinone oxidoreductase E subunit